MALRSDQQNLSENARRRVSQLEGFHHQMANSLS